jgi:adenylate cyclase class IV
MSRSIEVEIKFEILDMAAVSHFVKPLEKIANKKITDTYLDTPDGDLFKKGIFIRVRDDTKFDIKFNLEDLDKQSGDQIDHTHCDEVSSVLPLSPAAVTSINETLVILGLSPMSTPSVDDFMKANNLIRSLTIQKQRASYQMGDFHIDIDDVLGLGHFLEIEKMTDEHEDRTAILTQMRSLTRQLELAPVDVGYNELYWRKHDPALYRAGKYLLAEDRT